MRGQWITKPLGEVVEFQRGLTYSKKDEVDLSSNIVLRANNIDLATNSLDLSELRYISDKIDVPVSKKLRCGSLLICTASGSKSHLGKVALVDRDYDYAFGGFMGQLTAKPIIDSKYLFYFMISDGYKEHIRSLSDGVNINNLRFDDLKSLGVPLPPLPEQQRIVAILDEAFAGLATATDNAEKNLENARELFDSQLQSVFLNSSADWKQCTLEEVCSFASGGTPPKDNASYWKGSIPWVSGRDMKTDRLRNAALHISQAAVNDSATRVAPVGALLILVRGMGLANGIAVAEVMSPCAFNQDIKAIHPTSEVNPRFLLLSLRSAFARTNKLLSSAAHGTLKIEMDALREVRVSVPPRKIQDDIASRIDAISTETQRLVVVYKDKLARLAALKQSILQKAFSGDLTSPPIQAIKEAAE